ncbi:hypothetical protein [Noviherbaspirillum pedocola]|uniref:Uncharacterized protein n=1 Tax=Noviherbaspirillum pedocola TaxID=2801341 RepID=A0A934T0I8_9BURK|nr:hypothetical protein [Noviherbaspirillum pedocola]MBK4738755.1 hypothetical protein [Noviherbaspirillum pedocola]
MASQLFHHPGFQIAVPLVAALLIYRVGVVLTDRIVDIPVQNIRPQPKPTPLGSKTLPTVYIPAKPGKDGGEGGDVNGLFSQPAPPEEAIAPPGKEAQADVPEVALADYLANLKVTATAAGGAFINGVFYRVGSKLDVEVPQRDGSGLRPTLIAVGPKGAKLRAGRETCELPIGR